MNPQSRLNFTPVPEQGQTYEDHMVRLRGQENAQYSHIVTTPVGYEVPSQSGSGSYIVSLGGTPLCSCRYFKDHQQPCKHISAVEYFLQQKVLDKGLNVEGNTVERVSYRQNWHAYNAAQVYEQELFSQLLRELCDAIPQPPQGKGRPRLPLSDMVFAVATKVYGLMSARRSMTDIRNAQDNDLLDDSPCFNSILGYLRKPELTPLLRDLIKVSALPLNEVEVDFGVDSSGFSTNTYNRWFDHKWGKEKKEANWIKAHINCGVKTNVVTSATVTPTNAGDPLFFKDLVQDTAEGFDVQEVSADKAYLSGPLMEVVYDLGGTAYIPFKSNSRYNPKRGTARQKSLWRKAYLLYQYHREEFNEHYHKRSNVETTFWMVKSKFGHSVRAKSTEGQINEVLVKILCHNIVVLIQSIFELQIMPVFETKVLLRTKQSMKKEAAY